MFQCDKCKGFPPYPGAPHTCEGEGAQPYVGPIPTLEFAGPAQAGMSGMNMQIDKWAILSEIRDVLRELQAPLRDEIAMRLPDPSFHDIDEQRQCDKSRAGKHRTDDEIKSFLRYRYADAMLRERTKFRPPEGA